MAAGAACVLAASAASATTCLDTDVGPTATGCQGFFAGNILDGKPADVTAQQNALAALGFTLTDAQIKGAVAHDKVTVSGFSPTLSFNQDLTGDVVFGIHYGNGKGGPGNATAFYSLDLGSTVLTSIQLLTYEGPLSDAVLYVDGGHSAVPEPATWGLMLVGFAGLGAALRSQRKTVAA
jgi:hypothetical protein